MVGKAERQFAQAGCHLVVESAKRESTLDPRAEKLGHLMMRVALGESAARNVTKSVFGRKRLGLLVGGNTVRR